ncbi:MAG: DUF3179 domain-containing protein [Myxococcota bacterium]
MARCLLFLACLGCAMLAAEPARAAPELNGFSLDHAKIPVSEILRGGPARDGIPALTDPKVLPAEDAPWSDGDRVIGVVRNGRARAYPIAILNWHELVNDSLGGKPILVSFCPLCGTGMVFDRSVEDQVRSFGVSGLLYRSDLLLYDRETESLWSQIAAEAVTGASSGRSLTLIRSRHETWGRWRARHPDTSVLSPETGHTRNYKRTPYGTYATSSELYFPVDLDRRYHPKTRTLGIRTAGGIERAYPSEEVIRAGGSVTEDLDGLRVSVTYHDAVDVFEVVAPRSAEIVEGYWFAWIAFHPNSTVFVAKK